MYTEVDSNYEISQKHCEVYFSKANVILKERETYCAHLSCLVLKPDFEVYLMLYCCHFGTDVISK